MFIKYLIRLLFLVRGLLTLLSPPLNVTVQSVNFQSELRWSPGTNDEDVQYTVQYSENGQPLDNESGDDEHWIEIDECSSTRARRCNLTFDVFINATVRVRAHRGEQFSNWSLSRPFKAIEQTRLGPPNVTLWPIPETSRLVVRISDPFHNEHFAHNLKHRLYYRRPDRNWKIYNDALALVSIDTFEVGLNYCVKADYVWHSKLRPNSVPSSPKCAIIPESESARSIRILWVMALVVFLVLGVSLLCIYMVTKNYSKLKQAMQPPLQLPEHLHEFLSREEQFVELPESSTSSFNSEEEPFDKISLVAVDKEVADEEQSSKCGLT